MKHVFSYGLWLGAILSYTLIFLDPQNNWVPYANGVILFYEIFCWIAFVIIGVSNLLFLLAKANAVNIVKQGTSSQFAKALEMINKPKLHYEISRYLHYIFIVFVGVFIGDVSMTIILTLNAILFLNLRGLMKSLLKEAANG